MKNAQRSIRIYNIRIKKWEVRIVNLTPKVATAMLHCDQAACLEAKSNRAQCTCHCKGKGHGALKWR